MKNKISPLLLRRQQVCQALNISPATLDRLRNNPKAGFPNGIYTGNKILGWKVKDIHNWLDSQ
ncbi:AlpA family phage regulatory protein [Agarivorans sp. B2Z047]|uniref:helix-turn-helix transcriptional regulator n=1 Tax=Agarivorans sp. B2Z047 TaxID=2652721 RepID=UPI00128CB4A7|nr:AlpA family phage regulatory protein [Agarivorans sp. B2Z047]MPW31254.1 AlpA family phage regulatory protein [Agarivorans sp. B2Z047]UQN42780.1 AlpA family phage regulatory protein [Agarivorans sp. B2Z047]